MMVKLQFLAPAGIAEVAKFLSSVQPFFHDAQMLGPYWVSNPLHLTVLTAKSEDYTPSI